MDQKPEGVLKFLHQVLIIFSGLMFAWMGYSLLKGVLETDLAQNYARQYRYVVCSAIPGALFASAGALIVWQALKPNKKE